MAVVLTNNATTLLAASIAADDTALSVQTADAGKFPAPAAGEWFPLTIVDSAGNMEIVKATARSGAIITVERAQEGTTAKAFAAGARVDLRATVAALNDLGDFTTTDTVGAAIAASDAMTGVSDGDHFAGLSTNFPIVRKFTWGNIKSWLRDFFDARFVQMGAPTFSSYKMDITSSSFSYMFWRSAHVAFVKKTGGYNFYWRRNDTGAEGGPNEQTLMSLSDSGLLSTQQGFSADSGSASMAIQPDGNIRGTAFGNDQYLTTYIVNKAETARANAVNQAGNNVVNLYKSYAFNLNDSVGCTVYGRYTAKGGNVAIGNRIAGSQLNVAKANGGGWGDGGAVFGGTWVSLTGENAGSSDRGCWKKVAD